MATTREAVALTAWHQREQSKQAEALALLVVQLWGLYVDPLDPAASAQRWLELLIPRVQASRRQSEALARLYVAAFQRLEFPDDDPLTPDEPDELPDEAIQTSLYVTGPRSAEKNLVLAQEQADAALEREVIQQVADESARQAGAAAYRHAINGGREQVLQLVRQDDRALGYVRVTKTAKPCYFCVMLVSRGPVYKDDSFAASDPRFIGPGEVKVHDNCGCGMEPVYSRAAGRTPQVVAADQLWRDYATGSGAGAVRAFRNAYDALNLGTDWVADVPLAA